MVPTPILDHQVLHAINKHRREAPATAQDTATALLVDFAVPTTLGLSLADATPASIVQALDAWRKTATPIMRTAARIEQILHLTGAGDEATSIDARAQAFTNGVHAAFLVDHRTAISLFEQEPVAIPFL